MKQRIMKLSIVVADYDQALDFYVGKLGFELIEDRPELGKRWVVIAPPGGAGAQLVLGRAKNDAERACIGRQTGGRVFLFLETDDFWRDYDRYRQAGVKFLESPREESYGTVVVFEDLYGNRWDLIESRETPQTGVGRHRCACFVPSIDCHRGSGKRISSSGN